MIDRHCAFAKQGCEGVPETNTRLLQQLPGSQERKISASVVEAYYIATRIDSQRDAAETVGKGSQIKKRKRAIVRQKEMKSNLGEEPPYFDAKAIYKINFPLSLWNELTDEQRQLAKDNGHDELTLKDEVQTYKFSEIITK